MKFDYKKIIDEVSSKDFWPRIIIMLLSIFLLAINYNLFLLHNDLVIGGTSGLATIVSKFMTIKPATFIFVFNILFILISFIFLGPKKTGMTIIGSILYPVFVSLTSNFCNLLAEKIVLDNFLLVVLLSGLLFGISNGFIYKTGFSTGGCDIAIQIVNKYLKVPTGIASFAINFAIILLGGIVFGLNKAIYATLIIIFNSFLVDKIMLGISDSKMFYIHTKKAKKIQAFIREMHTGYTLIKTEGGYTNKENDLIMCVISTKDYYVFKNVVEKIDPHAFFIISDCYEVYGGHRREKFPFI